MQLHARAQGVTRTLATVTHTGIITYMSVSAAVSSASSVQVRSAVPGRYRLWVAGLYQNDELKSALERTLNGGKQRSAHANVVAGTLLVEVERGAEHGAEALACEVATIVDEFAVSHATTSRALERRGLERPLHFALSRARTDGRRVQRSVLELGRSWLARVVSELGSPIRIRSPGRRFENGADAMRARHVDVAREVAVEYRTLLGLVEQDERGKAGKIDLVVIDESRLKAAIGDECAVGQLR